MVAINDKEKEPTEPDPSDVLGYVIGYASAFIGIITVAAIFLGVFSWIISYLGSFAGWETTWYEVFAGTIVVIIIRFFLKKFWGS